MLIRTFCILVLLFAGPVTAWAAATCCDADGTCCGGEDPRCPALPDGSCSIAAASPMAAAVTPAPEHPTPIAAPRFEFASRVPLARSFGADLIPDPDPPHFLLHEPLRN
jgi:hypothetical protein